MKEFAKMTTSNELIKEGLKENYDLIEDLAYNFFYRGKGYQREISKSEFIKKNKIIKELEDESIVNEKLNIFWSTRADNLYKRVELLQDAFQSLHEVTCQQDDSDTLDTIRAICNSVGFNHDDRKWKQLEEDS
jgi:hypothetical protein